jgi:hypothetical protein
VRQGTTHTDEAIEAIRAGCRARWQARRERASLTVTAIDDALELMKVAQVKIARVDRDFEAGAAWLDGSFEAARLAEAQTAADLAIDAMLTAAHLLTTDPEHQQ